MFEGDSADMCAGNFPCTSMGAEWRVLCAQTRVRGPSLAYVEFHIFFKPKKNTLLSYKVGITKKIITYKAEIGKKC